MDKTEAAEKLAAAIERSPGLTYGYPSVKDALDAYRAAPAISPDSILPEGLTVAQVYRVLVCVGTANTGLDLVEAIAVSEALRKAVDHE